MARLARKDINTPFLHIMTQGINKEFIFNTDVEKNRYLKLIKENCSLFNLQILAYCIMSNHVHMLIFTEDINELSRFMHTINLKYASTYNNKNNRCGVIFRNRYKIQPIENRNHLLYCINYIHQNPVKANMVSNCNEYKYSSYNDYLTETGCAKNSVLSELMQLDFNFIINPKSQTERIFIDINKPNPAEIAEVISCEISTFLQANHINLIDIFSNRKILKELIIFLKTNCGVTYKNIQDYLEISKNSLSKLIYS